MADDSVIIEGVESDNAKKALYTTVHGAGRVMSRTKSAGRKKWVRGRDGIKRLTTIKKGDIDFDEVKRKMSDRSIVLRGGDADEAPECYKSLEEVLKYQGNTIRILFRLHPVGVAMAGPEIFDPYKD
jgi:tRNA-splicing ligase RtcB